MSGLSGPIFPLACANCTVEGCQCARSRSSGSPPRSCSSTPKPGNRAAGSFAIFAYRRGADEQQPLRRRRLPLEQLEQAVRWALDRGCDSLLIDLEDAPPIRGDVVHHLCADPACPGGC